jgi:hypothetical protein
MLLTLAAFIPVARMQRYDVVGCAATLGMRFLCNWLLRRRGSGPPMTLLLAICAKPSVGWRRTPRSPPCSGAFFLDCRLKHSACSSL